MAWLWVLMSATRISSGGLLGVAQPHSSVASTIECAGAAAARPFFDLLTHIHPPASGLLYLQHRRL